MEKALLDHLMKQARDAKSAEAADPGSISSMGTLKRIEEDKAEARRLRADGLLSLAEFAREMCRLEKAEKVTRETVPALATPSARPRSAAARIVREWNAYTVDMKRREMGRSIEAVVVAPAGKGGAQRGIFRPDLIEIVWK